MGSRRESVRSRARRQGDKEIRRQGDKEIRRQGDKRFRHAAHAPYILVSLSPCLEFSPCLLVSLSPCLAWPPARCPAFPWRPRLAVLSCRTRQPLRPASF